MMPMEGKYRKISKKLNIMYHIGSSPGYGMEMDDMDGMDGDYDMGGMDGYGDESAQMVSQLRNSNVAHTHFFV